MKKKTIGILLGVLTVILLAGIGVGILYTRNIYTTELSLAGSYEMTLEYGETYVDPGAYAAVRGSLLYRKPRNQELQISGSVNTDKIGTYFITYTSAFRDRAETAVRSISVVDTQPPEICLETKKGAYTLPGQPYAEEGFTASDDYDGDLTDRVKCTEAEGVVTYTVSDSSGNVASATRKIFYDDPVAPEIKLKGHEEMYLEAGGSYQEPGYSASDNCDGDLTEMVSVSGQIDATVPGTYELLYTVKDSYGNQVNAKRTVHVYKPEEPKEPDVPAMPENPVGGVIYLTFDDGPSSHTDRLLDVLGKYGVKATFFVVNTPYISKVQRIAAEGHTVGLHTATHVFSDVYASDEAYFADLQTISDVVEGYTGQKSTLIRFPGGSSNTISRAYCDGIMTRLTQAVQEQGYHYFDWNVDSFDAGGARSADEVFYHVINGVASCSSSVVLQHDLHGFSVDAVERIIQWGMDNGYTFLPLTADSPQCHHRVNN